MLWRLHGGRDYFTIYCLLGAKNSGLQDLLGRYRLCAGTNNSKSTKYEKMPTLYSGQHHINLPKSVKF